MKTKAIIFDADGVVIISPMMFSARYQEDYNIPNEIMLPFFKGKFRDCLVGKADLKEELEPFLAEWKWQGTVDELLHYWFKSEHYVDEKVLEAIRKLREKGIKCYLATNQEKYRTEYMKKEMGFEQLFDKIYSSAEIGCKKTDKTFFECILNDLAKDGIAPEEVMYFDDEEENVATANLVGIKGQIYTVNIKTPFLLFLAEV